MFGKSNYSIKTTLNQYQLLEKIDYWYEENELTEVANNSVCKTFRFGSPAISNPIYIKVFFKERPIQIQGWVQTPIPILRWKLVEVTETSAATHLDYRRKGGLLVSKLKTSLNENNNDEPKKISEPETHQEDNDMTCPYCKEDIKEGAVKCKHCGSLLKSDSANPSNKSMPLKQFMFSLQGRIPRSVYWVNFYLPYAAIATFALLIDAALGIVDENSTPLAPVFTLISLLALWPAIAVGVKRCHDRNKSGWFFALLLVPILNIWPLVELFFLKGTTGSNKYGDDPLGDNAQNSLSTASITVKTIIYSLVVIISYILMVTFFLPENLTIEPGDCTSDSYITENGLDFGFECSVKVTNESDSQISQRLFADLSWDTNSGKSKTETQYIDVTLPPNSYKVLTFQTLKPTVEDMDMTGNIQGLFYSK